MYCSRDCQRAHWKAEHKQRCIAKVERSPQPQKYVNAQKDAALSGKGAVEGAGEKCVICQDELTDASSCTLPCAHVFHITCVAELRRFGVDQACPLCRSSLPPGPLNLFEDAVRRYTIVQ
jgi:hypothetical protein